ncbi:MAG: hypothetical protein ACKVX7_09340 [Planctomycetota bacterium]
MFIRKIGKILRGKATPFQIASACVLGSLLGFLPGYKDGSVLLHSPGMLLVLFVLVAVLNANFGVIALCGLAGKLLSLAVMPVAFSVGEFLLDGPTQGIFKSAINTPVLAWFGLHYYATTGCLALGLAFGIVMALLVTKSLSAYRRKMAALEENSEGFKRLTSKRWVKLLLWLFVGGGTGKKTYAELAAKKVGNPVRVLGVVFAGLTLTMLYLFQGFFSKPLLTSAVREQLAQFNGATVDLDEVDLQPGDAKLSILNLAMADSARLERDMFRATQLEGNLSLSDLLTRRFAIDRLVVSGALHGETRKAPGVRVGPPPEEAPPPAPPAPLPNISDLPIEEYLQQAEVWIERFQQVKHYLDEFARRRAEQAKRAPDAPDLKKRLREDVKKYGWTGVSASHLVEEAPTVLIREILIEGLKSRDLPGETLRLVIENVSTQPWLVEGAPRFRLESSGKTIDAEARLGAVALKTAANHLSFAYRGISADEIGKQLKNKGEPMLKGGTIDLGFTSAPVDLDVLNWDVLVNLRNSTITLPGSSGGQPLSSKIENFELPLGVRGTWSRPRAVIDQTALTAALKKAGADALVGRAREEVEKATDQVMDKAKGELEKATEKALEEAKEKSKGLLDGLIKPKKD